MKNKLALLAVALVSFYQSATAQTTLQNSLHIITDTVFMSGGNIYMNNASFINDGTFLATGGVVHMNGTIDTAKATIDGSSQTAFHQLKINSIKPHVYLGQHITVKDTLDLTYGLLDIGNFNATILGSTVNESANSYIWTSGLGRVLRDVTTGSPQVLFPVGVGRVQAPDPVTGVSVLFTSYNPARIQNTGTTDRFGVRFEDTVRIEALTGPQVLSSVVDGTWYVNESVTGGSSLTLELQWNANNEMPAFDQTLCFVTHYTASDWDVFTTSSAAGTGPYMQSRASITSLSPFKVTSDITVLPIELLSFEAIAVNDEAQLNWVTGSETNGSHFNVERSANGRLFETIGQVLVKGNTPGQFDYNFFDKNTLNGFNYYRLKMVDHDGQFEYSAVRVLNFSKDKAKVGEIFPNPSRNGAGQLIVNVDNDTKASLELFDLSGRLVNQEQISLKGGFSTIDLNIQSDVVSQFYRVRLTFANGEVHHRSFVVAKD